MSSVTRPRGPLPARVYWVRRLLVLGLAFVLVFTLARVLGGSSDGKSSTDGAAAQAAAQTTSSAPPALTYGPTAAPTKKKTGKPKPPPLPEPDGACRDDEVVVQPVLKAPQGGGDVTIRLDVYSNDSQACTFTVSPSTVVVKLVSGKDFIWSSQECPKSLPDVEVIARRTVPGKANVVWSGRRSDTDCRKSTDWARPGWYHAVGAALGGEATDVQFELLPREAVTITETASPKQSASQSPDRTPSASPSGATEPPG
ncbi:conserved exported hypothetical protein [metagenome]|uniref:DUF4232 domain-containing protein n=1 Tax=metagenome TaxID=256318 RepID=A0A2P2BXG3_9ZZZZ